MRHSAAEAFAEGLMARVVEMALVAEEEHLVLEEGRIQRCERSLGKILVDAEVEHLGPDLAGNATKFKLACVARRSSEWRFDCSR